MQEVTFSRKTSKSTHPHISLTMHLKLSHTQKSLGIQLNKKRTLNEHTNTEIGMAIKGIELFRILPPILPRSSLLIIHKSFIRSHLEYGVVIYDKPIFK